MNKRTSPLIVRKEIDGVLHKKCPCCDIYKPLDRENFYYMSNSRSGKDGYQTRCKECQRTKRNWSGALLKYIKDRSKAKDWSTDLTKEYLEELYTEQSGKCYWYGITMELVQGGHTNPLAISVDRLDNTLGYIRGNVVLSCFHANVGRMQTTPEDYKKFLDVLRKTL